MANNNNLPHTVTLLAEVQLQAENEDNGTVNLGSGVYLTRWSNDDIVISNFPSTANPQDYCDIITFEIHLDAEQQQILLKTVQK